MDFILKSKMRGKNYFFVGIAGSGMSAIAQYLSKKGKNVKGSDRLFVNAPNHPIRRKLEDFGIKTFVQGQSKITDNTDFVVISTAIEETVYEYEIAKQKNIPIIHRSDLLKEIADNSFSIAVAGTSGKSTTTAMIYSLLNKAGLQPSMLNGSGLVEIQNKGLIGNAAVGDSDILVFEADESDGTLVKYHPKIGILLNIDRDHKDLPELFKIFEQFANNSKTLISNKGNKNSALLANNAEFDFGKSTNFTAKNIKQTFEGISFSVRGVDFKIPIIGLHNVENALAAISLAQNLGIDIEKSAQYLRDFRGIDRRMQIINNKNDVLVIDDYAHNPAKITSAIRSAQALGKRLFAFFQAHGYGPLKFMKDDLLEILPSIMRKQDYFILSPVYYAGGTVVKQYTSKDFFADLQDKKVKALYFERREDFCKYIKQETTNGDVVLIMGARDPSLGDFAKSCI